jgi:hypothetical protein
MIIAVGALACTTALVPSQPKPDMTGQAPPGNRMQIRTAVAERAKDFSRQVDPADLKIIDLPGDKVPGFQIFMARVGSGRRGWTQTGVQGPDGEVIANASGAVAALMRHWLRTGSGKLPDAVLVTEVTAFILGNGLRHVPILSEADGDRYIRNPAHRAHVKPPALVDIEGRPGVGFWWLKRDLQYMEVWLEADDSQFVMSRVTSITQFQGIFREGIQELETILIWPPTRSAGGAP